MIRITDLSVVVTKKTVLDSLCLAIAPSRITVLIGKSGAGKTTLLKTIANLLQPATGTIQLGNTLSTALTQRERARTLGYIFQDFNLFENLTVLENCVDPLRVAGFTQTESEELAKAALAQVGMDAYSNQYPYTLSGGQKQRVAIARACALKPKILLMDEPTASLDPENTKQLCTLIRQLQCSGLTVFISSQDLYFIENIFDEILYLNAGSIQEHCTKETFDQSKQIQDFLQNQSYS